jgi:hypothetical protein
MELDDVKILLTEKIQSGSTMVVGVELLHNVDLWFGESKKVGSISIEVVYSR